MLPFAKDAITTLRSGGIAVIPTDTIYGIVGRADLPDTVARIYRIRERNEKKPCIILIASTDDLLKFGIRIEAGSPISKYMEMYWPARLSIIFPVPDPRFEYLTRGTKSLAFRMPDDPELRKLIKETGPLVAPSANKEGEPHARTIADARKSFGDLVDLYVDGGALEGEASKIVRFESGEIIVVRE